MSQFFKPSANTISRTSIVVALGVVAVLGGMVSAYFRSPYWSGVGAAIEQPVPFSHQHHVAGLGIDCRYCHTSVETSSFAGIPSTGTCMNCHSQVWTNAELLEPVRNSWKTQQPLRWKRVHDVPDYVHFNHSIHLAKGIGCASCHGPVDQMPLMWKDQTMFMMWCLDCHREPEKNVRPKSEVFNLHYKRPTTSEALAAEARAAGLEEIPATPEEYGLMLLKKYDIRKERLDNCSVCHR